ncbi:plasmid pRiA4b ORF-3 family protein [Aquibacillus koreensis]|uniref:Plasmid pRiA4b ORF-3 family protein n=1 Tax=Aquibacillus koreensis TaxID=279446 RepID=A0A9X3WSI8_9BACI|nr:plasmid pRiA4b ORF-3 family protein [Aquibacillus koreensis]MCT2536671.1 plasmid pRiA4b ORF-3 family protein [Aquibacillus koreensis]MDC3422624.1 plasmid pRiA4b ORF-3 family protein [Aquibacillus koreensis]
MKAYQIKIELLDSDPLIWRRVIMPAAATFNRLHDVIQNTLNFQSGYPHLHYHLFEFDIAKDYLTVTNNEEEYHENKAYKKHYKKTPPSKEDDPFGVIARHLKTTVRQPQTLKIDNYLEKHGEFLYTYDFGDNWRIKVTLEEVTEEYYYGYPTLLDGAETAPPEDVGGIPGYYDFLSIYHDKNHPDYQMIREWAKEQSYREYDEEFINRCLKGVKYKKTEWDKLGIDPYRGY